MGSFAEFSLEVIERSYPLHDMTEDDLDFLRSLALQGIDLWQSCKVFHESIAKEMVSISLVSGVALNDSRFCSGARVSDVRERLQHIRPTPQGSGYRLTVSGRMLEDSE